MSHPAASEGIARLSRRAVVLGGVSVGVASALPARLFADTKPADAVMIEMYSPQGKSLGTTEVPRVSKSTAEWRAQLSPPSFAVTRQAATEAPFSGVYDHYNAAGLYHCICCATVVFDSRTKFDSGTGWPSFWSAISHHNVTELRDNSLGMQRTAVQCKRCDAHLGHVFDDGPRPTGLRYCMNSVALQFAAFA